MPQANVGRNDPCPCGSGKKYKKCCLSKDEAAKPRVSEPSLLPLPLPHSAFPRGTFESNLDKLSNSVLDAIDARHFDEAERLCEQLRTEFPEVIDGRWRLAMVREAQERFEEAAALYGEVLEEMRRHAKDYDQGAFESMERDRVNALSKIAKRP
jgi:hypothetical protein